MVTKCANPSCGASFKYMCGGRLYLLDSLSHARSADCDDGTHPEGIEYFWLCGHCIATCTIVLDQEEHPRVVPKSTTAVAESQRLRISSPFIG